MAPRTTRSDDLARLLAHRVAATEQPLDGEVSVAELRRRLIPYEVARADLALATKAEYDLALLELLAAGEHLAVGDEELAEAARRELEAPEPGLAFLQDFAASHLRLRLTDLAEEGGADWQPTSGGSNPPTGSDGSPADTCWSCREVLPESAGEAQYCVWCGSDLMVRPCGVCGAELQDGWRFCPRCGEEAA